MKSNCVQADCRGGRATKIQTAAGRQRLSTALGSNQMRLSKQLKAVVVCETLLAWMFAPLAASRLFLSYMPPPGPSRPP